MDLLCGGQHVLVPIPFVGWSVVVVHATSKSLDSMKTEDGFRKAMQIHSLYNKMVALQPRNICLKFPKAATLPEGGVLQVNHSI